MSSSRSSSTSSNASWLGDWDQPGNVVDTLGLRTLPDITTMEKKLRSQYSFDRFKEFSDLRIFSMQSSRRFSSLLNLLQFPCQPFFSSIFNVFNFKLYRYKPERLLQRRICLNFCNWNPSKCFLEESHSGSLTDLMSQDFHNLYNPDFQSQFNHLDMKPPQLEYDSKLNPPNVRKLIDELAISSNLTYENGFAVNFEHLADEFRKADRPFFTYEEKKCHDIIEALLTASNVKIEHHRNVMEDVFKESFTSCGKMSKPILSLMLWGPQPNIHVPTSSKPCKLEFDPDPLKKIHECNNFVEKHYWMFGHGGHVSCDEGALGDLDGPAMTRDMTLVYPCNLGKCNKDCLCDFCERTRTNICPLNKHKKHLTKFDEDCLVQKAAQCQEHWVDHPENYNEDEDILVEKNLFYHNNKLVDHPRSYTVQNIKFAGIKKSCATCRRNIQNHFEEHMTFHLQCKFCLFQITTLQDSNFWRKVCKVCSKVLSSDNPKLMNWHMKIHSGAQEFKCSVCDLVLKRKYTLVRHLKEIHDTVLNEDFKDGSDDSSSYASSSDESSSGDSSSNDTDYAEEKDDNDAYVFSIFKCNLCDKPFRLKRYLNEHVNNIHGTNSKFNCEECGVEFKYKANLKRHKVIAHMESEKKPGLAGIGSVKIFSCETCSKEFKRKDYLRKHLASHHHTEEKFSCEFCGKSYQRNDKLKEHITLFHSNPDIGHNCNLCGKKLSNKANLKRHLTKLHNM